MNKEELSKALYNFRLFLKSIDDVTLTLVGIAVLHETVRRQKEKDDVRYYYEERKGQG